MADEIIDRKALARLLEVIGGDREDLLELLEDFQTTTPTILGKMQQAVGEGNVNLLRISAHSLKSNSRDFGAMKLSSLCERLEHDCRDEKVTDAGDRVAEIGLELETAKKALSDLANADE